MDRMNLLNSYESKASNHEDQLTRGFLLLLKHSSHSLYAFIDYCRSQQEISGDEKEISIIELLGLETSIHTQKSNPIISTENLISVLITNEPLDTKHIIIEPSERDARYDGIIEFAGKTTIVIENKPRVSNVLTEQLNPSKQNLSSHVKVFKKPIVLQWQQIIKHLNSLCIFPGISPSEKIIIDDFIEYVDNDHRYLNPYDNFQSCKDQPELLNRRISNILKSIVNETDLVKYHRGWGYYIETPYKQIKKIGLNLKYNATDNNWSLDLSFYFGANQRQARDFYENKISLNTIDGTEWQITPNFHVGFASSNLYWFGTPDKEVQNYINFWCNNVNLIQQIQRENVQKYLFDLVDKNIISYTDSDQKEFQIKYFDSAMTTLNIIPELAVIHNIDSKNAKELDQDNQIANYLELKIKQGLGVIGFDGKEILK